MTGASKARQRLSLVTGRSGTDGVLIVSKDDPGAKGADPLPGAALRWPPCECGHSLCPDYGVPESEA